MKKIVLAIVYSCWLTAIIGAITGYHAVGAFAVIMGLSTYIISLIFWHCTTLMCAIEALYENHEKLLIVTKLWLIMLAIGIPCQLFISLVSPATSFIDRLLVLPWLWVVYFICSINILQKYEEVVYGLKPLEYKLLKALCDNAEPEISEILMTQIHSMRVSRLFKSKEVDFYYHRRRGTNIQFPCLKEMRMGRVYFYVTGDTRIHEANIWIVGGHLFQIMFYYSPSKIPVDKVHIKNVEIYRNPMDTSSCHEDKPVELEKLTGWVKEWVVQFGAVKVYEPLMSSQREQQILEMKVVFPQDYLELMEQTNGLESIDWIIKGITEIQEEVDDDDGFFFILAEKKTKGILGVKQSRKDGMLFYIDYEDLVYEQQDKSLLNSMSNINKKNTRV